MPKIKPEVHRALAELRYAINNNVHYRCRNPRCSERGLFRHATCPQCGEPAELQQGPVDRMTTKKENWDK